MRRNQDRPHQDQGAIAVYAAILAPALAVALMFFVDAAARWNTWRDASAAASAAARAGAEVSPAEFVDGRIVVDPARARQRAMSVLSASGYRGTVVVQGSNPPLVVVTATATVDYVFVGGLGATVDGQGEAAAESGVVVGG